MNATAPADEYDDYAAVLQEMVAADASVEAIRAYLSEMRAEVLLMAPNQMADRAVAESIAARADEQRSGLTGDTG